MGWSPDAPQRKAVASTLQRFNAAAPHLIWQRPAGDNRPILLYKAWTTLFAKEPPYPAQQIGDCVSFGHAHANDLLQCIEWVLDHGEHGARPTPNDIQETDTEALYALAREAGGMLGNQDGCFGSAAIKAMTTMGVVSRRQLASDGKYSGQRAKQWGRSGAPDNVKQIAVNHKLGSGAQVSTWDELVSCAPLRPPRHGVLEPGVQPPERLARFRAGQGPLGPLYVHRGRTVRPARGADRPILGRPDPIRPDRFRAAVLLVLGGAKCRREHAGRGR